jgi:hypothetical protein
MRSETPSDDGSFNDHDDDDWQDDEPTQGRQKKNNTNNKKRKSVANRKLVRWNRAYTLPSPLTSYTTNIFTADKDQYVLLVIESICSQKNIPIPWNDIAKEVEPYCTGEAIKQHLTKVFNTRKAFGFRVPKRYGKPIRPGKNTKVKMEDEEDSPVTPGKNAGLLHWVQEKSKSDTKKNTNAETTIETPTKQAKVEPVSETPKAAGRAGRGGGHKQSRKIVDDEEEVVAAALASTESEDYTPYTPSKNASNKRGRKPGSRNIKKQEDSEDETPKRASPPKKRKVVTMNLPEGTRELSRRNKTKVDYRDQLQDEDQLKDEDIDEPYAVQKYDPKAAAERQQEEDRALVAQTLTRRDPGQYINQIEIGCM